jgi:hypothetical protein
MGLPGTDLLPERCGALHEPFFLVGLSNLSPPFPRRISCARRNFAGYSPEPPSMLDMRRDRPAQPNPHRPLRPLRTRHLVEVELHPHAVLPLRRIQRHDPHHVSGAQPLRRRRASDLRRHFYKQVQRRSLVQRKIRGEENSTLRQILRLRPPLRDIRLSHPHAQRRPQAMPPRQPAVVVQFFPGIFPFRTSSRLDWDAATRIGIGRGAMKIQ